jgi:uncharacterized protein YndB with AHSA1/START domain
MKTPDFDPGPLAQVAHERHGEEWTLVFVRELPHPAQRVWEVLTDPAHLRAWSPYTANRNLSSTGAAVLTMLDGSEPADIATMVTRAEAPNLLEYVWRHERLGSSTLRWQLEPAANGTRLTLHQIIKDLQWVPKVAAGWHLCLVVAERLLDGHPLEPIIGHAALDYGWNALHEAYAEKLRIPVEGADSI